METTKFFTESEYVMVEVPVMRNGKPTKRMKKEWQNRQIEVEYILQEYQGHKFYVSTRPLGGCADVKTNDGESIYFSYTIGGYGQKINRFPIRWDVEENKPYFENFALQGMMGRGSVMIVRGIEWK